MDVLLIYPKLGSMDSMVMDIPLSIIYAAADSVKSGFKVKVLDLRCEHGSWKTRIKERLDEGVLLAGVSVMTGTPLRHAREISLFIKENNPQVKVVWGGPHVTLLPETIREDFVDFLIRGWGSVALSQLILRLKLKNYDYAHINGLSYKSNGDFFHNMRSGEHEALHYADIPYGLVDVNSRKYGRFYMGKRFFPIFTSLGCPYRCSFCMHPAAYKEISGPKWRPYPEQEVIEHIEYIINKFKATHICFIDDTSFPDLKRMRRIFEMIINRGIRVSLEFRGARINEIDSMSDDFLNLMVEAGGRVLMVGVESASNRVLDVMQKGITREQILRVNKKLARFPQIKPHYNFIYGTPAETYDDLIQTKDAVLTMLIDNPNAYFGFGSDWKPIPGSHMLTQAQHEYGFKAPRSLDEWIEMDSSDAKSKISHPWYTKKHDNLIKLMQITSFVIDDKIIKESALNRSFGFKMLRLLSRVYKPIAFFRLRFNFHHLLIEYGIWRAMLRVVRLLSDRDKNRNGYDKYYRTF